MSVFKQAAQNNLDAVKLNMTHVDMVDDKQKSLLHHAVVGSAMDVIEYLLNLDANVNFVDRYGETPLFDAARKGKVKIAKRLIQQFAQINVPNRMGELPIHLAAFKGDIDMIKLLVESGAYLNKKTEDDRFPIHYAVLGGQYEVLDYLLKESKQSYFLKDDHGNTLLHYGTRTNNVILIDKLLHQNLNPNALNDQFETPIFNAVRFGNTETVRLLLAHDAFIDIKNRRYETPIDTAVIYDKQEVHEYLLEYTESPKYERLANRQALTIAVLNRDHPYLRQLILKRTPLKKDRLNKTAMDYAKEYQMNSLVNLLQELEN